MQHARALLHLSRRLHAATSLEAVVEEARQAIAEHTRYQRVYVHLLGEDRVGLEIIGYPLPNMPLIRQRLATVDVAHDRLLQKGFAAVEPFVIPDLRDDPDANQELVAAFGNRTIVCIPMFDGDAQIGPFIVATYADEGIIVPTDDELDLIVQVASLVAVVIGRLRAEAGRAAAEEVAAAQERSAALGRMAGAIAHDFNNILLAVLSNAELAAQAVGPDHPALGLIADIEDAAVRAGGLSRQLLAAARGQVLERRRLEVGAALAAVERLVRPTLAAGVTVTVEVQVGADVVDADPGQLERVLMNLVVNARDAGARRIAIDAATVDVDGDMVGGPDVPVGRWVVLTVSDDGPGMPPEVLARAFEPFYTTKEGRGTGLGLAVVDGIVRQHGGLVRAYSEAGQGCVFRVYLPAPVGAAPAPVTSRRPLRGEARVLVVDDDAAVRRAVERVLTAAGYVVTTAATAAEALAQPADVVITDIVLGDDDGVALAGQLRARDPAPVVILMTGFARGRFADPGLPLLHKPFPGRVLLDVLARQLDG